MIPRFKAGLISEEMFNYAREEIQSRALKGISISPTKEHPIKSDFYSIRGDQRPIRIGIHQDKDYEQAGAISIHGERDPIKTLLEKLKINPKHCRLL